MKNFKIILEYDGTAFFGWQRQKKERTVQSEIEAAIQRIVGEKTAVNGSGRTDAGVHALGQTANFLCQTRMDAKEMHRALNAMLPKDISIRSCERVSETFHARFDAVGKTYQYRIDNRPIRPAVGRHYAWHIRSPLDLAAMKEALPHICGTHDFKAFEGAGSPRAHTVRTVFRASFQREDNGYVVFEISANGFLKFMVRNLVGTLVQVGMGKLTPKDVKTIREAQDRQQAPATAPPQGLFLIKVEYDEKTEDGCVTPSHTDRI